MGRVAAGLIAAAVCASAAACSPPSSRHLRLATTSSVENSGLLAWLLPRFAAETAVTTQMAAVGSGIAIDMLKRGQVDVVISHAPAREAELLKEGGWVYRKIMFNDFVLVGPPGDPAGVRGTRTIEEAMQRIAASGARFISRGDSSGTHEREKELWTRAGFTVTPSNVVTAGSGMGATLRIAATTRAYTLSDRATFDPHAGRGELILLFEGGPRLINTYAAMAASDAPADARRFIEWLATGAGRDAIHAFRTVSGARAFNIWPASCPPDKPDAVPYGCL